MPMESRRLKRYDSAPLPTGSTSAGRAAAAAAHGLGIPRPHVALSGSPQAQAVPPQPPNPALEMAAYEKQLEHYYKCMEEDNATLSKLYEVHTADIAALRTLSKERKFKDTVFTAMEAKAAAMDAFFRELMDLTSTGRGLRLCPNANHANAGSKKSSAAPTSASVVSIDEVRDAVQRQQHALQAAQKNEENQRQVIQTLKGELASLKSKGRTASTRSQTQRNGVGNRDDDAVEDDCCLPGTAKQMRDAQRKIRELERQLTRATRDAKDGAAEVSLLQQQKAVDQQTLQRREGELAAMHNLLTSKENLISSLETEVRNRRSIAESQNPKSQPTGAYHRTNSAPAAVDQHRSGEKTSSDSLIMTHHYRLFAGQTYVEGQHYSPGSFKDSFLRSVSTLLKIPYGYLTAVEVRTHSEAVSIELDIRHSASIQEDEIDFLLLSHGYPEVVAFLDKAKAELKDHKPLDRNTVRIKELEAALAERVEEVDCLRRVMRSLEASLDRRDADREALNTEMECALHDTEMTVKEVYEALQTSQVETGELQKALTTKSMQLRLAEKAKAAAADAAALAEEKFNTELLTLREQLSVAETLTEQLRKEAMLTALQHQACEKPQLLTSSFHVDVALPVSLARSAPSVLKDSQKARVLQMLVLCHTAQAAGVVPVVFEKCSLGEGATTLKVAVELAFFATKEGAEAAKEKIADKLNKNTCNAALEYLRMCNSAAKREVEMVADAQRAVREAEEHATASIAAMRTETQEAATAEHLREIHGKVSSILPGGSCDASSVVERIGQLALHLAEAESTVRNLKEENRRATRQLADAQQEREQLQQTLSDLTARLSRAENDLRDQHEKAVKAEGVLEEKVKRLEVELRAKAAVADSERSRISNDHKATVARLAGMEEALAIKETELARLQTKAASSGPGAAFGGSAEGDALREALRLAKHERAALARQVREMDTDMNDLSNIQASMQRELEVARQELRAKKHDFDLLVKQLVRMEEKEKKWTEHHPSSPVSPKKQDKDTELDDVARESLLVLTNSNITLQQCLRRLQSAVPSAQSMLSNATDSATMGSGAVVPRGAEREGDKTAEEHCGARRSGHRKSAIGVSVSRAAAEHQKLSTQLTSLLVPMLEKLAGLASPENMRSGRHDRAAVAAPEKTSPARIMKRTPCSTIFSRKASAPPVLTADPSDRTANSSFAVVHDAATASHGNTPKRVATSDATLSAANILSGGKVIVDAPPRLEFHRQTSSRTYIRSNTATSATVNADDSDLTPAAATETSGPASSSADVKSSGAHHKDNVGERKEKLQRRISDDGSSAAAPAGTGSSPTGVSVANIPSTIRRHAAPMAHNKINLSRRPAAGAGGPPVGNASIRSSAYRRLPTVTTAPAESTSSTAPLAKRIRPIHT